MQSGFRNCFVLFLSTVLCTASLYAQTGSTTGEITGRITDSSNSGLPGVTVTATNEDTGQTRTAVTESDGAYRLPLLSPGSYRVAAELSGLGQASRENIQVSLGSAAQVSLNLNPSMSEEITVTADSPLVDTNQSGSTEAVSEQEIENLPILGRDFKDLILLTPGVTTAFGGRVALVGARGTAVDFNIDGANANSDFFAEERGGTSAPYVFSQAAIKQFQVIRTTYSAEYSRGGGGTMNAITKSGANDLAGELFYYKRDEEWADDRSTAGIDEFFDPRNANQYGLAIGGPIVRDKLFFFGNLDFQDIKEPLTTADIRNNAGFIALPADVRQAFITRIEGQLGYSLDQEFRYDTKENQETLLGKIDWNIGNSNHFNVRWNNSEFNNLPSESTGTFSNQGEEFNTVNSYVGQLDSILSSSMYNFGLVQYSLEERPITNINGDFPSTGIRVGSPAATFTFGQRDFLPNGTDEEKWEIKDTFSYMRGQHQFKTGFNYLTVDVANLFVRDRSGDFVFGSVQDFLANKPSTFEQGIGVGTGVTAFDFNQWGVFVMDTWRPMPKLTVDLGVRYDAQSMPKPFRNIYEATNPELDENFVEDDDNVAPRVGFAYDLRGDGRSVLRGGVGRYYNFIPAILLAQPIQQTSGLFSNYSFNCATTTCPTYPNILTPEQLRAFNATAILDIVAVSPNLEAAESDRGSLGYEQELWTGYSFEVEGVYAQHNKQQRLVNVNAIPTGLTFGNIIQYTVAGPGRPYPNFRNVRMHVSDAEGEYTSATIGMRKAALNNSKLSWLAHYTWSEATDQDTNSRSTSTTFSYDPFNPSLSDGPSDNDVTHRVVGSGTYELPFGFFVSGIYNWRTGQPYTQNIFYSNGARSLTGLTSIGVSTPVFVDNNGEIIDISLATGSTPTEFASFLNTRGARIIGRNRENQPDFTNLDLRLSKRFGLPAGLEIELIGEIFNVFNEANQFITATNQSRFTISETGTGSNLRLNITRNANYGVENGLDFNSPPRQYQAAAKIRF